MAYTETVRGGRAVAVTWRLPEGVAPALNERSTAAVEFEVAVGNEALLPAEVLVDTGGGLVGDGVCEVTEAGTCEHEGRLFGDPTAERHLSVYLTGRETGERARVDVEIPPPVLFDAARRVTASGLDKETVSDLESAVSADDRFSALVRLQGQLKGVLSEEAYYDLVGALAAGDDSFAEWWADQQVTHFRNRVTGRGTPDSPAALETVVAHHNRQDALPSVSVEAVLKKVAGDLTTMNEQTAERVRESFEFGELGEYVDSEVVILRELVTAVEDGAFDRAERLVGQLRETWPGPVSTEAEYETRKERAKAADYGEKSAAWLGVLVDSFGKNRNENRFVLAKFLYLTAKNRRSDLEFTPEMQEVAAELLGDVGAESFSLHASYEARVDRGHDALYVKNEVAAEEFTAALSYAAAPAADWSGVAEDYAYAYTMAVVAGVHHAAEDGRRREALRTVSRELDAIRDPTDSEARETFEQPGALEAFTSAEEHVREDQAIRLEGEKHRIRAEVQARQGDFESAIDSLRDARQRYGELGFNRGNHAVTQYCQTLEALRYEQSLAFEAAKRGYEAVSADGSMSEYRAEICAIKADLLDGAYGSALSRVAAVDTEKLDSSEVSVLGTLARVLSDYKSEEVTDLGAVTESLQDAVPSFTGFDLPVSSDYRVVLLVAASVQYVREAPFDTELLDLLVETTLQEALVPTLSEEATAGEHFETATESELQKLSVSDLRTGSLPHPVVDEVNEAEVDRAQKSDPKAVGFQFWYALELTVSVSAEYHVKAIEGTDVWRTRFADESFTNTAQKLLSLAGESPDHERLERVTELADLVGDQSGDGRESEAENTSVRDRRNERVIHPEKPPLDRDQLEPFRARVYEVLDGVSPAVPVVCTVEDDPVGSDTYRVRLHWNRTPTRAILETDDELNGEAAYYLPPERVTAETVDVPSELVVECENGVILDKLADHNPDGQPADE